MEQFRVRNRQELLSDLLTGAIIALLSVPLSMGYAQVAGLPAQYGLYGSFLSTLLFGVLTTSRRFVFGVDAASAALVSVTLVSLGVPRGGMEAVAAMPSVTLFTALWLFLFLLMRGGRFARYVSESVLGGCVSAIATMVILAQLPLLFGGDTAVGHGSVLILYAFRELRKFHLLSFLMGVATVAAILFGRLKTRMSVSVIMMAAGILSTQLFHVERYGVKLMNAIPAGLPGIPRMDFSYAADNLGKTALDTLAIALVIAAETLVSTRDNARKYDEYIDNRRELLAYALTNAVAAAFGSSPVGGSISRTRRAERRGVHSQWMSVSSFVVLGLFLLFGTPLISYLPVPVLSGIVIGSLITMLEFRMAARLWKVDRSECNIFIAAFAAEFLGLSTGVIVGVFLTFASFTMRASSEKGCFLGILPGREGYYDMNENPAARPIPGAVIYQFTGPLFFATIHEFKKDIRTALRDDTRLVVVTGVTSVDMFAAEQLLTFYRFLCRRDIVFHITGNTDVLKRQLTNYGVDELVREGVLLRRLTTALKSGDFLAAAGASPAPEKEKKE